MLHIFSFISHILALQCDELRCLEAQGHSRSHTGLWWSWDSHWNIIASSSSTLGLFSRAESCPVINQCNCLGCMWKRCVSGFWGKPPQQAPGCTVTILPPWLGNIVKDAVEDSLHPSAASLGQWCPTLPSVAVLLSLYQLVNEMIYKLYLVRHYTGCLGRKKECSSSACLELVI